MKTCELPNGDKIKIKTTQNWYLLKGLNPHGSAWGRREEKAWYVPNGFLRTRTQLEMYQLGNCSAFGFVHEVVNIKDMFKLPNSNLFIKGHGLMTMLSYYRKLNQDINNKESVFNEEIINSRYTPIKFGYSGYDFLWFGVSGQVVFYEAPLTKVLEADSAGNAKVLAIWQSYSTDSGKTWSKPIITKDAKLFVIGESMKEQPGIAKDKGTLKYIGWF